MAKIALGAWAWGNDGTFGNNLTESDLRPIFDAACKAGLNLWDKRCWENFCAACRARAI